VYLVCECATDNCAVPLLLLSSLRRPEAISTRGRTPSQAPPPLPSEYERAGGGGGGGDAVCEGDCLWLVWEGGGGGRQRKEVVNKVRPHPYVGVGKRVGGARGSGLGGRGKGVPWHRHLNSRCVII
jgi:hypothetical protein